MDEHDHNEELEDVDDLDDDAEWADAINKMREAKLNRKVIIKSAKTDMLVIENSDPANINWMHTLPGYKDEVEIIKNSLKKE